MIACDQKYLHSPKVPADMDLWPFNVPSLMAMLETRGLEVNTTGHLDAMQAQIDEITERWRCAILAMA